MTDGVKDGMKEMERKTLKEGWNKGTGKQEKTNIGERRVIHRLSPRTHPLSCFLVDIVHVRLLLSFKHRIDDLLMNSVHMCIVMRS